MASEKMRDTARPPIPVTFIVTVRVPRPRKNIRIPRNRDAKSAWRHDCHIYFVGEEKIVNGAR